MTTDATARCKEQADIFFLFKGHRNIDRSAEKVKVDGGFLISSSLFFQIFPSLCEPRCPQQPLSCGTGTLSWFIKYAEALIRAGTNRELISWVSLSDVLHAHFTTLWKTWRVGKSGFKFKPRMRKIISLFCSRYLRRTRWQYCSFDGWQWWLTKSLSVQ